MTGSAKGPMMTIGAFARASRLSVKALRLYEQHHLLAPHHVDANTGYRYYIPTQFERARLIAGLREIAMPLATVADVLAAEDQAEADRRIAFWWAGQEHVTHVRRQLVQSLRASIDTAHSRGNTPSNFPVAYRDTPERLLLTEQSTVTVDQLPTRIAAVIAKLAPLTTTIPSTENHPVVVIYHGRVNDDSDGPVEVCLTLGPGTPVDAERLPTGVNLRRQAGHREAFTALTKNQLVYPDILAAYDQIDARVAADRNTPSGPPREYYCHRHPRRPTARTRLPRRRPNHTIETTKLGGDQHTKNPRFDEGSLRGPRGDPGPGRWVFERWACRPWAGSPRILCG